MVINNKVLLGFLFVMSVIGTFVFTYILLCLISELFYRLKHLTKKSRDDREKDIDNLVGNEVPFYISRFYFHTLNLKLTKTEKVLMFLFPHWYMDHHIRIIGKLFQGGYCWYFAHFMKLAFNRGDVCWAAPHSHFVWKDVDGKCWDSEGRVHENSYSFFIPESYLSKEILFIYQQTNYKDHECIKPTVDNYVEIVDNYAVDNNLEYNKAFVMEMLEKYVINGETKNMPDIKEKTGAIELKQSA